VNALKCESRVKNLHLQESRLRRRYRQDAQELQERQAKRQQEEQEQQKKAAPAATSGFEFTNSTEEPGQRDEKEIGRCQRSHSVLFSTGSV
jgi:hypothetical protein